jgi:hypothetical protein
VTDITASLQYVHSSQLTLQQCDLARPGCQRCFKYGTQCPGYRDQQDLIFRNTDPSRSQKRKGQRTVQQQQQQVRLQGPICWSESSSAPTRHFPFPDDASIDTPTIMAIASRSRLYTPQLYMPITQHWTSHSIPIMLNIYAPIEYLTEMYYRSPPNGLVAWSAHIFSRTYITNLRYPTVVCIESYRQTQRELGMFLGKLLSAVSSALATPAGAMRDDILIAVWTLANYELLMGSLERTHLTSPWHSHVRGLYGILKTRGLDSLRKGSTRAAFWSSYTMIVCPPTRPREGTL